MNFCFENKTVSAYKEIQQITESVNLTAETVVPDTGDDIAAISSIQSRVLLKAKDNTSTGVCVTGEVCGVCICITENGGISHIRISKDFEMNFETEEVSPEIQAHIFFSAPAAQGKLVNPRKISLTFEISGMLRVFNTCETVVDSFLPPDIPCEGLHMKYEEGEITTITYTAEKNFAISELYSFAAGNAIPTDVVWEKCDFRVNDVQMIGAKAIVRGDMNFSCLYVSDNVISPTRAEFSSPFSQIIETGSEESEFSTAHIEMTAIYADIQDAINGEKTLNVEVHAVLSLIGFCKRKVRYVSDLYSNLIQTNCCFEKRYNTGYLATHTVKFNANEIIKTPDDCEEIISVFLSLSQPVISDAALSVAETADIIYRSVQGELCSTRRWFNIEGEIGPGNVILLSYALRESYVRTDGNRAEIHGSVEVCCQSVETEQMIAVESVVLEEDASFDYAMFPTVTLVRADSEDLWIYAKTYHSDVNEIQKLNNIEGNLLGKLLIIPKTL